ncbi:uncharacterized protein [Euwallacea fornicatus]|uniref:uncharacterized protein isoform X1 n=1 Tax=Euwallacea fornicatus TaxID=995702 RepID=UPI00338DCE1F
MESQSSRPIKGHKDTNFGKSFESDRSAFESNKTESAGKPKSEGTGQELTSKGDQTTDRNGITQVTRRPQNLDFHEKHETCGLGKRQNCARNNNYVPGLHKMHKNRNDAIINFIDKKVKSGQCAIMIYNNYMAGIPLFNPSYSVALPDNVPINPCAAASDNCHQQRIREPSDFELTLSYRKVGKKD